MKVKLLFDFFCLLCYHNNMRNLALILAFDGSGFCGWQVQPNGPTVQQSLELAIERVTGAHSRITGCSRTDAGVHAREFVCNFHTQSNIACTKLPAALNFYLPPQIAVCSCREAPETFHARYDCVAKTYRYHIHNTGIRDPFLLGRATLEPFYLDANMLHAQAQAFLGTHDFTSFCAAGSSVKTHERTVTRFDVERNGNDVYFFVQADGFLYNMVRIMTGTLVDIAKGKLAPGSIPAILQAKGRTQAGVTAPPEGLMLWKVEY